MTFLTKKLGLLACAITVSLVSCKKLEFDKISAGAWNPNLAVPLAHAKFGVYDILALTDSTDLVVSNQNTEALAIVYKGEIFSTDVESLVIIADVNQNTDLSFADLNVATVPAFNETATSSKTETIDFNIPGAEIHQVNFKSGVITLSVSTTLAHDIACVITFPELKKNGVAVTIPVTLNYTGTLPHTSSAVVDLTNALADFTIGNTTFNKINATIATTITGTGNPIIGNEELSINFGFSNLKFKNAYGFFGQENLGITGDTIPFKVFQNSTSGYFELVNPKIKFLADNSFGFPIRIDLSNLKTIDTTNGNVYPLTGYPSTFLIQRPTTIGQTVTSVFELNTSNTNNLSTVISSVPKDFVFSTNVQTNPEGNVLPLNFITDTSKLKIRTEIELPMEGSAYGFELKDTVEFNFNEDVSQLETIMFRLNVDNGFPVEVKAKIVFLNQNYHPVFTVFNTPESVVESALVDNNGKVNKRTKKITDISLTPAQIALIPQARYLLIYAVSQTLNGPTAQVVKLFEDYTINLKLALQVQGKIQL